MGVRVQAGTMRIPTGTAPANYYYEAAIDTASPGEALTVTTANPSNPRRDLVVAYIDKAVAPTASVTNNSNNVLKLAVIAGTPASSPSDPTGSQITTAIGASNPYIVLARIAVGVGVTQITNSDISDLRTMIALNTVEAGPWKPWTPFISAGAGSLGATSSGVSRYMQIGKTVHFNLRFNIQDNGNGSSNILATLPVVARTASGFFMCAGREDAAIGKMLQGKILPGNPSSVAIFTYDNIYPGASGGAYIMTGVYEAA
jgi:hypothetical protein